MITTDTLMEFCEKGGCRKVLENPFRKDGWIYATNGKVGIAIPDDGRELARKYLVSEIVSLA